MHRAERGFTLVEVMVALALTTALLSAVYAGLWITITSTGRIASTIADNDSERTITHFLRQQLRHVETRGLEDSARFSGDARSLRFSVRHFQGDPSLRTFRIGVPPGNPDTLTIEISASDPATQAAPLRAVLITELESLALEYHGASADAPKVEWHQTWSQADKLPQLVRVKYRRSGKSELELFLPVAGIDANQVTGLNQ